MWFPPQAATWTTGYDLAGRVVTLTDPDTGTSTRSYDNAGDLTATTDARGTTLAYSYDALGRKTGQYLGTTAGTELASWTYDTLQAGQPTGSTRYTPAGEYTVAAAGDDSAGNLTGTTVSLPASETGFAASYTTGYTWTSTHLMASQAPASGGSLPVETIQYNYDGFGKMTASAGAATEVSASAYSPYGEPLQYSLGVNNQSAWLTYTLDPQTRRVTATNLSAQNATPQIADTAYSYDPAGNLTRSVDTQGNGPAAPVETQCYRYDTLDRLTQAWSATDGCAADPAVSGNATVGGPQPFWTSWSVDSAGSRIGQTGHALPGAAGGDTVTVYTAGVAGHAHALAGTATTGPGTVIDPAGSGGYSYDPAGDTLTRTLPGGGQQSYTWTVDGRLDTATGPAGTSSYVYDADGTQLVRHDPASTTVYLPGEELTRDTATGAVKGTRYYTHGGTVVAERVGHANLIYLYADPHGTNQTAAATTQAGVGAVTRRALDPYGNPLTSGGAWPDSHTFLNKPRNPTTGLIDLGARPYNPATGRFLAVDPVLEAAQPQQLNGYAYANNNPITFSDPAGTMPIAGGDVCTAGSGDCDNNGSQGLSNAEAAYVPPAPGNDCNGPGGQRTCGGSGPSPGPGGPVASVINGTVVSAPNATTYQIAWANAASWLTQHRNQHGNADTLLATLACGSGCTLGSGQMFLLNDLLKKLCTQSGVTCDTHSLAAAIAYSTTDGTAGLQQALQWAAKTGPYGYLVVAAAMSGPGGFAAEDASGSGGVTAGLRARIPTGDAGAVRVGRAPEYNGGQLAQDQAMDAAQQWLGSGYKEVSPGRYVSDDGLRVVRYGAHETRGAVEHIHFEAYENGFIVENTYAEIIP